MFRFTLKTFLLSVAVIAAPFGWWCSWPNRTATVFAAAIVSRDTQCLASVCPDRDVHKDFQLGDAQTEIQCDIAKPKRTISDFVFATGDFTMVVSFVGQTYWGKPLRKHFSVRIERGAVYPTDAPTSRSFATMLANSD